MVFCVCTECNSKDMKLSGDEKYLICNKCGDKNYIRHIDIIGLEEYEEANKKIVIN